MNNIQKLKKQTALAWPLRLLHERAITVLTLMFCTAMVVMIWQAKRMQSNLVESTALQQAAHYSNALTEFRTLYTAEVANRVRAHGIEVTHDYAEKEGAIPLPATLSILLGNRLAEQGEGGGVRLYSEYPFPWRTDSGARDDFELEALHQLQQTPEQVFYRFEEIDGHPVIRYASADLMRPSCVECHNTHPDSPKRDWEVGDVRGVLEVTLPLDAALAEARNGVQGIVLLIATMALFGLGTFVIVIRQSRQTANQLEERVIERTAQLQESEALFYTLANVSPVGILKTDVDSHCLYVNQRWCEMAGLTLEEALGSGWVRALHPADRERIMTEWVKAAEQNLPFRSEYRFQRPDGATFWLVGQAVPLTEEGSDGKVKGYVGTMTDISERKQAEERLKASLKEKEVLLKEIHHRVKNNLQIISSLLYLQSQNIEDESLLAIFKESENRVRSMALIHEQLYQTDNLARINLADYIQRLTNHLVRSYGANHISLQLDIGSLFLTIDTAIPCGLIINELVTNALKYAFPEGEGGQIEVQMQAGDDHQLTLSVKDNGVGFPKDVNFRRPRSLGLTLVTTLVKQLKGTIELQSEASTLPSAGSAASEGGTEFIITFDDKLKMAACAHSRAICLG